MQTLGILGPIEDVLQAYHLGQWGFLLRIFRANYCFNWARIRLPSRDAENFLGQASLLSCYRGGLWPKIDTYSSYSQNFSS